MVNIGWNVPTFFASFRTTPVKEKINKLGQGFFIRSAFSWSRKQDESGFPK